MRNKTKEPQFPVGSVQESFDQPVNQPLAQWAKTGGTALYLFAVLCALYAVLLFVLTLRQGDGAAADWLRVVMKWLPFWFVALYLSAALRRYARQITAQRKGKDADFLSCLMQGNRLLLSLMLLLTLILLMQIAPI